MFNGQWSRTVERRRKMFNAQCSMVNGLTVFPHGGKGRSHKWDSSFPLVGRVVPTGGTPTYLLVYFPTYKTHENITKVTKKHHQSHKEIYITNIAKTSPNITKTAKTSPKHHQPTLLIINILNTIGDVSDVFSLKKIIE